MNCHYCKHEIDSKERSICIPEGKVNHIFHALCHPKWESEKHWEKEMQRLANLARRT